MGLHTDSYLAAGLRVYRAHCYTRNCSLVGSLKKDTVLFIVHALALTGGRVWFKLLCACSLVLPVRVVHPHVPPW